MTVYVVVGFALALLGIGAFFFGLGYLVRSVGEFVKGLATLLPPAGGFLGDLTALRETAAHAAQAPPYGALPAGGSIPWPVRREPGVAPGPVNMDDGVPPGHFVDNHSPTDARLPTVDPMDMDIHDQEAAALLRMRSTAAPPGPPIAGER